MTWHISYCALVQSCTHIVKQCGYLHCPPLAINQMEATHGCFGKQKQACKRLHYVHLILWSLFYGCCLSTFCFSTLSWTCFSSNRYGFTVYLYWERGDCVKINDSFTESKEVSFPPHQFHWWKREEDDSCGFLLPRWLIFIDKVKLRGQRVWDSLHLLESIVTN